MGMFDDTNPPAPTEIDPELALSELVGEGKKYKTAAELAKAYFHLEVHTGTVEQENADLRLKTEKSATIQDILAQLSGAQQPSTPPTHKTHDSADDDLDIATLVKSEVEKLRSVDAATANRDKVKQAFIDKFGPQAGAKFKEMQNELGTDLEQLAATSPQLVLKLLSQTSAPAATAPVIGSGNRGIQLQQQASFSTRKGIEEMARKEGWSRDRKYKVLHTEMDRAIKLGRLDEFNS